MGYYIHQYRNHSEKISKRKIESDHFKIMRDQKFPMDNQKDSQIITMDNAPGDKFQTIEQPINEINRFFNRLPIRILNSHEEPFFYLEDLCNILKLKDPRTSIRNFDPRELVSAEMRAKYNIHTYKIHRGKLARDDRKVLLTEFGVYRLLMNTRTQLSEQFRNFVYDILYELRTKGRYEIQEELQQTKITLCKTVAKVVELQEKQTKYQNLVDKIHIYEIKTNPTLFKQIDLAPEDMSDDEDFSDHDDETPEERRERQIAHYRIDRPEVLAAQGIEIPNKYYRLSTEALEITNYTLVHTAYCKNAAIILRNIGTKFASNIVGKDRDTGITFDMSKEKIIELVKDQIVLE